MRSFRAFSVLLCLSLMVMPLVITGILEARKLAVRYEMNELLENNNLVTLHISSSALRWYKKDKELLIGSSLFDVKTIVRKGSGYVITGLFDEKEQEIKDQLQDIAKKEGELNNPVELQLFHALFYEEQGTTAGIRLTHIRSSYPFISEGTVDAFFSVLIPPPRVSLAA